MRIHYRDDEEYPGEFALFRANTDRALAGKKGQAALRILAAALRALPAPRLIAGHLAKDGEVCAVGALIVAHRVARGQERAAALAAIEATNVDGDDDEDCTDTVDVATREGVPRSVAWRLAELNDMDCARQTPEARYASVCAWVRQRLHKG